jgi:uncharacterized protein (DUF433 family)
LVFPWLAVHPHSGSTTELDRISRDVDVMGGKPCIRGTRVTVGVVVGLVATGKSFDEILQAYPYLALDDIKQALSYSAWRVEEIEIHLPHEISHRTDAPVAFANRAINLSWPMNRGHRSDTSRTTPPDLPNESHPSRSDPPPPATTAAPDVM